MLKNIQLDKETEVLLGLLRNHINNSTVELSHDINWDFFLKLAKQHHVSAIVYKQLKNHIDFVPPHIFSKLHKCFLHNAMKNMQMNHDLGIILAEFAKAGISVIVLKGAYLANYAYANIALRPMVDIDLLLHVCDLKKAEDILLTLGYKTNRSISIEEYAAERNHIPPLCKPNHKHIELHWHIVNPGENMVLKADDLWENAIDCQLSSQPALCLNIENMILHLAIHIAYHHLFDGKCLLALMDISLFIKNHVDKTFDWQHLAKRSKDMNCYNSITLTLYLAYKLFEAEIPKSYFTECDLPSDDIIIYSQEIIFMRRASNNKTLNANLVKLFSPELKFKQRVKFFFKRLLSPIQTKAETSAIEKNYMPHIINRSFYFLVLFIPQLWRILWGQSDARKCNNFTRWIKYK